jgi:hypothetical protein
VSVLRSFSPAELEAVVRGAGLRDVRIQRRFFYRLVASASPVTAAGAHTL